MNRRSSRNWTTITADPGQRLAQSVRDLFEYRELFWAFVVRDLKVRYKQTALGVVWVVLQPLITSFVLVLVLALVRGRFDGANDLMFFMAGMVPWISFQQGVNLAGTSLVTNANMVTKIYFPRMTVPAGHVMGSVVDFLIAFATLLVLALALGFFTPMLVLWMPVLVLIQLATALGISLVLSALNAQYRDVKYAIPFLLQLGLLITVIVPLTPWQGGIRSAWELHPAVFHLLSLNPMAVVNDCYRQLLFGEAVNPLLVLQSLAVSGLLLWGGMKFFSARERKLVDVL